MNNTINSSNLSSNSLDVNQVNNIHELISLKILSNCSVVDVGSTFTYTIIVENKSELNLYNLNINQVIYQHLRVLDVVIDSTNILTYDKGHKFISLYINELKANERKNLDIVVELVNIGEEAYISSYATLGCNIRGVVEDNKTISVNSTTLKTSIIKPSLIVKKTCNYVEAIVGDNITYQLQVENRGNIILENVIVRDLLSSDLQFVNDSILMDGIQIKDYNIISGLNIGVIKENEIKYIEFKAKIISKPIYGLIRTFALAQYQYSLKNEIKPREGNCKSNESVLSAQIALLEIYQKVDNEDVSLGDIITFSIELINNGTLNLKNLFLQEVLDQHFSVVDKSSIVNDITFNNLNLSSGLYLGDLSVGEKKTLSFKARYEAAASKDLINCKTIVEYDYQYTSGLVFKGIKKESEITLKTTLSNFKYTSISCNLYKEENTPNIFEVDNVIADVSNLNFHVIKTIAGKSNEGQTFTGNKVVTQQMIHVTVEYTSDDKNNSVYTFNSELPFSTFIVLPSNYRVGSKINIDSKIEYINFKRKDNSCIYLNMSILIIAKVHSYDSFEINN